ncbi:formylmethanofuran dehydrogenase subunit E-like metal-binding protein [Methanomicrobium sp. W14]|uniref:FmdE family protein n=1 Tax=Methanomicrobium sp. W14 TaxID=2817839 RepID=UPI001AEB1DA4|nr:FmdE family protein [Methanomicrobium sp. W14]MBP2134388.1 formylmethanofuran dehydrogenase subunit E-like metal-binding protein [Methanomicrobium sp. W14]
MKINYLKLAAGILLVCLLFAPVMGASSSGSDRFNDLGQRAALIAMEKLGFSYNDPDVVALTDAGRVVIDGRTTEGAVSGITKVSGLQNGNGNLFQINRAEWKPLWFYFYDKGTGKGVYLEPDTAFYNMSESDAAKVATTAAFSKIASVTGDINLMLADTNQGNETEKALGGEAFSILSIANAWAHGAPYDLMYAASLHNHFCPGVSSGYIISEFVQDRLPLTDGTSYVVVSSPTWCKEDVYVTLWDMTPGKGGVCTSVNFTSDSQAVLTESYGTRPAGIFVLWNNTEKTGKGIAVGFNFDSSEWTGPSWGQKIYQTVDMVENLDNPEKYVTVMKEFDVDSDMLKKFQNPLNNPYEVCGMM